MRATKGTVCTISAVVMAAVLAAGGCAAKSSMDKETPAENTQETVVETETGTEEMEYVEYVSDEDWDTMVHVYRIIMDNYETAQNMVASGQADPSGIVDKAGELIEYGKACERDSLTAEEAGEKLEEMVNTADGMLDLIKRGGGTIVEIPVDDGTDAEGTDAGSGAAGAASEGTESTEEGGGGTGETGGTDSAEGTEEHRQ